jgi:ribosomal protein L7/L12
MNTIHRQHIINATLKISQMDSGEKQRVLLELLNSNPTIILRALGIGISPHFSKDGRFKVVITAKGNDKISLIRCVRCTMGWSLLDAKNWAEGIPSGGNTPGVIKGGLSYEDARELLDKFNGHMETINNFAAEVVPNTKEYVFNSFGSPYPA